MLPPPSFTQVTLHLNHCSCSPLHPQEHPEKQSVATHHLLAQGSHQVTSTHGRTLPTKQNPCYFCCPTAQDPSLVFLPLPTAQHWSGGIAYTRLLPRATVPSSSPTTRSNLPTSHPGLAHRFSHPKGQGNTTAAWQRSIPPSQATERPLAPRPGGLPAPPLSLRPGAHPALTTRV